MQKGGEPALSSLFFSLEVILMHIPIQYLDARRLSCATPNDWRDLEWLFSQDQVCPQGAILALSFQVSLPHPPFELFDYAKARRAFEDPKVAKLFGLQGCGFNKKGGPRKTLSHRELLDLILEKPPYSIATLGHVLGHALHRMVREMTYEHLPKGDDQQVIIFERVGIDPRDRSKLVIAFYVEPGDALTSISHRVEKLRVNLMISFLQDLFDGKVRFGLLNQYWKRIRAIEKAVRPEGPKATFAHPGHHEGNPAPSWPYAG